MGLAASQARFLAITSRKANCEFQSMQIAQQKLSLTRELEEVSDEYQAAINATNLVWDADGSGDYLYNLSYSLMMTPSDVNAYTPYLLSRRDGKIALNSAMAAAAKAAGISDSGFVGTAQEKAAAYAVFIGELQNQRAISSSTADMAITVGLISDAGVGGELMGRETANQMSLTSMITYIDLITEATASGYYPAGSTEAELAEDLIFDFNKTVYNEDGSIRRELDCGLSSGWSKNSHSTTLLKNGSYYNDATYADNGVGSYSPGSFSLSDLLNEDMTLLVTGKTDYSNICKAMSSAIQTGSDKGSFSLILNNDVDQWYDNINGQGSFDRLSADEKAVLTYFDQLAKGMYALLMPEDPSATDLNAFYTALDDIIDRFQNRNEGSDYVDAGPPLPINSESTAKSAVREADNYNCWVKYGNSWALSLSNLTETFLTNFVDGMNGYSGGFVIHDKLNSSYYITDDPGYLYTVNSGSDDEKNLWTSEFYSVIFNNLCQNGWYQNDQLEDKDYLDNAIKSGQLFVVSKGSDNYYYQSRYVQISGGHIMENTDSDAIAQAEVEYTRKKSQINYKEEQLEIEADKLDAEIAALTTEYDTVKSLISKNIEKTFTMFQT